MLRYISQSCIHFLSKVFWSTSKQLTQDVSWIRFGWEFKQVIRTSEISEFKPYEKHLESIAKAILFPYRPNKLTRNITTTDTNQRGLKVELDQKYVDTNSFKKKKTKQTSRYFIGGHKKSLKNSILAKGNNSSESILNATKVVHDL